MIEPCLSEYNVMFKITKRKAAELSRVYDVKKMLCERI